MARGLPALWSLLVGSPLVVAGLALHLADRYLAAFGLPLALLGAFVVGVGAAIQFVTPEPPTFREDEELVESRHPNQRPAVVKTVLSVPGFAVAAYSLYATSLPYVYPTVAFAAALYFYSSGILTYWRHSLTTYYLTDRRLISDFRFLTLDRKEIALDNVRLIQERESITEKLVGLGHVRVAAGVEDLEIVAANVRDSNAFAEAVRDRSP